MLRTTFVIQKRWRRTWKRALRRPTATRRSLPKLLETSLGPYKGNGAGGEGFRTFAREPLQGALRRAEPKLCHYSQSGWGTGPEAACRARRAICGLSGEEQRFASPCSTVIGTQRFGGGTYSSLELGNQRQIFSIVLSPVRTTRVRTAGDMQMARLARLPNAM
jgi:hypothetical protein